MTWFLCSHWSSHLDQGIEAHVILDDVNTIIIPYMIDKASSITVINSSETPYQKTLGPEIGRITVRVRGHLHFRL